MKARLTLWTCGRCRKPRGLHHACPGRREGRDRIALRLSLSCPSCGAGISNPLAHVCPAKSDFRKRRAAQRRRDLAEAGKRRRRASAARKRARARERKRQAAERRKQAAAELAAKRRAAGRRESHDRERHEPGDCDDENCPRGPCRWFREGREYGLVVGRAEGYGDGFSDGFSEGLSQRQ